MYIIKIDYYIIIKYYYIKMIIDYKIDLDKFNFIKNIKTDYLPYVIEEIFNIGYSNYVKSFIKHEIAQSFEETNIITENKNTSKGQLGESVVYDIIVNKFPDYQVENTSKIPYSGDIKLTLPSNNRIMVEVKNYNKTLDQEQVDKLKYDMKFSNIYYGIFISLNSGIVGKKRFELETFYYNKQTYCILYVPYGMHIHTPSKKYMISHNSIDESISNLTMKIEFSICIIESICNNYSKPYYNKLYNLDKNMDYLLDQLNIYYDDFRNIKNSVIKMEDNIKKSLESHINIIKDYEFTIKNNINKLINKKLNINNVNNKELLILIKKYSKNNWDILIDDIIYGKIICINNKYDLLFNYKNYMICDIFESLDECKKIIDNCFV